MAARKEKVETGQVLQQIDLDPQYFGEGITILNGKIIQLTYQTEIGFVYDQPSFHVQRTFNYQGEGWSLTNDGQNIYMDDGTAQIRIWDPVTLQEKRRITVHDHGQPVMVNLNELELRCAARLYANAMAKGRYRSHLAGGWPRAGMDRSYGHLAGRRS